mgnify:FL=1|jgi:hypothetical protein
MTDHHLDGWLARTRGVIGRYPSPRDRYILEWPQIDDRPIHMVGVPRQLVVEWWADGEIVTVEHLDAWVGHASHPADTVIEYSPESAM